MIGGAPVEPGLLDWVARSTGCDWHAAKKTTAAQNKWLWGPLRIGELIKSATLSVGATAGQAALLSDSNFPNFTKSAASY